MYNYQNEDRQFIFPFLLGGLTGGALVGVTRPRPVYVNPPMQQPYYPRPRYNYNFHGNYFYPY
mgnify:CR=1 FL=1